jgi:hypothetical protein
MDILHHFDNDGSLKPLSSSKDGFGVNPTRQRIIEFVKTLHDLVPDIDKEYNWISEKMKTKKCKPFQDKTDGLARLRAAERDLYYWYIEHPN